MITVLILFYIFSAFSLYKYTQILFSRGGKLEGGDTKLFDVILIFIPIVNTIFSLIVWISIPPKKRRNFNRFFNIK